jgi:penicillin-binding protein 1A
VLPPGVAATETTMLETVLQYGTAHDAAIGQFAAGKTGTTSNYGDAWFIGWDKKYTVAVWVGYPNSLVPMTNEYDGGPVLGGTFPALIWHNFVVSAMQLEKAEAEQAALAKGSSGSTGTGAGAGQTSTSPEAPGTGSSGTTSSGGSSASGRSNSKTSAPSAGGSPPSGSTGGAHSEHASAPSTPAPSSEAPAATPAPVSPSGGVSPGG